MGRQSADSPSRGNALLQSLGQWSIRKTWLMLGWSTPAGLWIVTSANARGTRGDHLCAVFTGSFCPTKRKDVPKIVEPKHTFSRSLMTRFQRSLRSLAAWTPEGGATKTTCRPDGW